ncbi:MULTISPECIES: DUF1236 domain-containing protein [unclassified Mesorhizobium]|uniref:DUF1236 domain-containing protein n=1 Tax=unclassified Mesorhizobium TaxID=325217 RepID=UPI00112C5AD4|nr:MULTISPECIES: DUF1236 domain-containing protein [unclassified Mesorhizobium]TPK07100.1 DUF1236 domain-containing protein [Mesorhizobium sp. B2-5-11]TPK51645.1 DUF1236 domain-containing protein [Mesorhizobium sp. B2-5-2]
MRTTLITSMLALTLGCGAAIAQTQQQSGEAAQSGGADTCAAGSANCQKGGSTEQQTQGKAGMKTDEQAQGKAGAKTDEQAQGKAGTTTDQQAQGKAGTTTDQSSTASINNISVEQKTEITNVIRETKVEPVSNLDVDISVGVKVPKQKVRLHRLPHRIVEIVPAYESYEYFLLADGRIVIVDPNSYEIVAILS